MLTSQNIELLREALAYWARHVVGLELTDHVTPTMPASHVHVMENDVVALFSSLTLDNVRYVVVDGGDTNHTVNTRLFRKAPKIQPSADRWQVRTVIG